MANSSNVEERKKAAELLHDFAAISDKKVAWQDLHRLTEDKDTIVRQTAAVALGSAFFHIPDKNAAWDDVIRLMQDEDANVQKNLVFWLGPAFSYVLDKNVAWQGLHGLMQTGDYDVQMNVVNVLEFAFLYVPDKKEVWDDLIKFAYDHCFIHLIGKVLGRIFPHLPDKNSAWNDLHKLNEAEDVFAQIHGTCALGLAFSYIPDKKTAWNDLHRLNETDDVSVREAAASALGHAFPHVPDKKVAWEDLHALTKDKDVGVRRNAASALGLAFSHVPDKKSAWEDLHRLNEDKDINVRMYAVSALRLAFVHISDKNAAWNDLHKFTEDGINVRSRATSALGQIFLHVPDKKVAWEDLHRLTMDEEKGVQRNAAFALGEAFPYVPDKKVAWEDLHRLAENLDRDVRMYAYHSLGSVSVYKATEIEDEDKFRDELKRAIDYFEKTSHEATHIFLNPASFCLPFYRSYYAVISRQQEAEAEAAKYLDVAKSAVVGSESRETLLKAVEYLANALKEAQKPLDFGETREHLRACKQYCDHTAELADSTRGKSPVAAAAIMRGIPIVGVKVKAIIAEIQDKAKEACQKSQGTPIEEIACAVNQEIQKWRIDDQEEMARNIENIILILKSKIPQIPQNEHIHEEIEKLREEYDMAKQYGMVLLIIALIPDTSVHIGDNVTISDVTVGDNSQIIGKGNENKNANYNAPASKKSLIDWINSPATIAAFIGFMCAEIGTYYYPVTYNHLISVGIASLVFIIVAIFNKK